MKREIDLNKISDGKRYTANDMVKADCHDCAGCSDCCRGMGSSIVLDPMDLFRLHAGTGKSFADLLEAEIELQVVDGLILPNLKMSDQTECCRFLNEEGRCSIHQFRPGICRMFPLGRVYGENGFEYFLQVHECRKEDRGKIKVKKWIGIPNLKAYETYIWNWHQFLNTCEDALPALRAEHVRILTAYILRIFYQTPYHARDDEEFYTEFAERMKTARETLGL